MATGGSAGGSDGKATVRETRVQSLGQEDPLEKEMATHSITLAWKIPWTEEPTVHGITKSQTQLSNFTSSEKGCIFRRSYISSGVTTYM